MCRILKVEYILRNSDRSLSPRFSPEPESDDLHPPRNPPPPSDNRRHLPSNDRREQFLHAFMKLGLLPKIIDCCAKKLVQSCILLSQNTAILRFLNLSQGLFGCGISYNIITCHLPLRGVFFCFCLA